MVEPSTATTWLTTRDRCKGGSRRARHPDTCPTTATCTPRTSSTTSVAAHRRQGDRHHRRGPAPDVGGAVLPARAAAHSCITSGGLGTMGFGLPAAIGAKFAPPRRRGVGDRRRRRLPDDAGRAGDGRAGGHARSTSRSSTTATSGMVRQWQEFFYEQPSTRHVRMSARFRQAGRGVRASRGLRVTTSPGRRLDECGAVQADPARSFIDFQVERVRNSLPDGAAGLRALGHRRFAYPVPCATPAQPEGVTGRASESGHPHRTVALCRRQARRPQPIASLFRRRGYNIASLNVGRTHEPGVSRMTIVVEGDGGVRAIDGSESEQAR